AGTVFAESKVVHGGHWAARLERKPDSPGAFSTLHRAIAMDFAGKTIEFRGFLRTEDVSGFTGLWMREDGEATTLAFDNMQSRGIKGTSGWTEYSITLPVHAEASQLYFGVLLAGTGRVWADDLQLLVDGKPVWEAPKIERAKTVLEVDHRFDAGSGVTLATLSPLQIQNLATLGKVWGFLKYHHPAVTSGKFHWDYELLRVLPGILEARDRSPANAALHNWITSLGPVPSCTKCATLDQSDLHLRPNVKWIEDQAKLGPDLSAELLSIYRNRPADGGQFFLTLAPGIGNPLFRHELPYRQLKIPDAGFQLLALYRFWNIVEYWSPYRDILEEDWDKVLVKFIPRIALAKNSDEYQRELMALIARMHDGHANLWSSLNVRPPTGDCQLPATVRFVENRAVITALSPGEAAKGSGLAIGDVITELDGVPLNKLIERWTPYYAASNEPSRLRDLARSMTRGTCGEANVHVQRENQDVLLKPKRVSGGQSGLTHDLPGEAFRILSKDVAYL